MGQNKTSLKKASRVQRKERTNWKKIYNKGNQYNSGKGNNAGDCLKEVRTMERGSFLKDQWSNGMLKISEELKSRNTSKQRYSGTLTCVAVSEQQ